MNEISVVLNQTPGKISWNYEEVKAFLAQEMEAYKGLVYTDDSIGDAKKDRAFLNKLWKQVDTKRKEAKAKCLEPYSKFEEQANELKKLISDPVQMIDEQVKAYEQKKQEQVKEEIGSYFDKVYTESDLSPEIRKKVIMRVWDPKWLNATTSKKTWKEAVEKGIAEVKDEIDQLKGFRSEFEADMVESYSRNLSFRDAVQTMNDLEKQKARVLELERQKQEEAAKAAEMEKEKEANEAKPTPVEKAEAKEDPKEKAQTVTEVTADSASTVQNAEVMVLKIYADKMQLAKIKGYINYVGASYEEQSV